MPSMQVPTVSRMQEDAAGSPPPVATESPRTPADAGELRLDYEFAKNPKKSRTTLAEPPPPR